MEQKELIAEVKAALDKGYHTKAAKLAKDIENEGIKTEVFALAAELKKRAATKTKKAEASEKKRSVRKPFTPADILKKYDDIIAALAAMDVEMRNAKKPYRVYFFHRRQIENLKRSFIKGTRGVK